MAVIARMGTGAATAVGLAGVADEGVADEDVSPEDEDGPAMLCSPTVEAFCDLELAGLQG